MVARTVEYLKEEQIGNICLFADADGKSSHDTTDIQSCLLYNLHVSTSNLIYCYCKQLEHRLNCMMSFLQQ